MLAPVPLVNDADVTKLHPANAPQLKKLVKPLLQGLLGAKEEKMPGYEHFFGMGGGWDYITKENAEASIGLLPELLGRLLTLRNDVRKLV